MQEYNIIVVDDEEIILENIKDFMHGYNIHTYCNPDEALKAMEKEFFDVVVSDYKMPGMNGMEFLQRAREKKLYHYGILLTAYAEKDLLEEYINNQLISKITEKPLNLEMLKMFIDDALKACGEIREEIIRIARMQSICEEAFKGISFLNDMIIGIDGGLKDVFKKADDISLTDENVLITGETGTGKEIVARAIHFMGRRKDKPFIKINCGAIPENLVESELFGYERGAFSGAEKMKPGRIELSHTGTLFLDEIGELSPAMQTRFLQVVQEKRLERVGGTKSINIDFRLICATNRDLDQGIRENRFRKDLLYRINTYHIHVPPLRERTGDISSLAEYLLKKYSHELGKRDITISRKALSRLKEYSWPGNIREFESVIKRALLQTGTKEKVIKPEAFEYLFHPLQDTGENLDHAITVIKNNIIRKKFSFKNLEKEVISGILRHFDNNIMEAVRSTGIPKDRFYRIK